MKQKCWEYYYGTWKKSNKEKQTNKQLVLVKYRYAAEH
jgi:hypothetical protein